jgi:hypothetical protein
MSVLSKLALFFAIVTVSGELANATPPSFAPYGASRGRIRYVEGPWRTRSTIHWGNGITPTGGQVLISGMQVAGEVLTSESFWSGAIGRDSEKEAASAEALRKNIDAIATANSTMRNELNKTLEELGLEPSKPVVSETATLTPTAELPPDLSQLLTEHREAILELQNKNKLLATSLPEVLRDGKQILEAGDDLQPKLSDEQLAFIRTRHEFFTSVANAYKKPIAELPANPDLKIDLEMYLAKSGEALALCEPIKNLAEETVEKGEELLPRVNSATITRSVDVGKRFVAVTEKWQAMPPQTTDLFKDYEQVMEEPIDEDAAVSEPEDGDSEADAG